VAGFEENFNYYEKRQFLKANPLVPLIGAAVYFDFVFTARTIMANRKPFNLRLPLALWSSCLAIFSIMGTIRIMPTMLHVFVHQGLHDSICVEGDMSGVYGFWAWAFILSKFPELVDTVFIVLRKQKLIFLHWFHHLSVLILVWFGNSEDFSIGHWFMSMNYTVHAIMYSYFALKAFGFRLPKPLALSITLSQLVQMFWGSYVTGYAFNEYFAGRSCTTSTQGLYISMTCYIAYLILFGNFFIKSYLGPKRPKEKGKSEQEPADRRLSYIEESEPEDKTLIMDFLEKYLPCKPTYKDVLQFGSWYFDHAGKKYF